MEFDDSELSALPKQADEYQLVPRQPSTAEDWLSVLSAYTCGTRWFLGHDLCRSRGKHDRANEHDSGSAPVSDVAGE